MSFTSVIYVVSIGMGSAQFCEYLAVQNLGLEVCNHIPVLAQP